MTTQKANHTKHSKTKYKTTLAQSPFMTLGSTMLLSPNVCKTPRLPNQSVGW